MFTGKTPLITGGTRTLGTAVLRRFQSTDIGEIRIFSRDETMWFTESGAQMIGRLNL